MLAAGVTKEVRMKLVPLTTLDLSYVGEVHAVRPSTHEFAAGWGLGEGTVTGERLRGSMQWSNPPTRRGEDCWLPNVRGVITTADGAELMVQLTGRTTFAAGVGHQKL